MPGLKPITAFILAGGFGTRLRQVVSDRPKALAEMLGRPYIFHLLDRLAAAGLCRVVLCTGHMAVQLEEAVGPTYRGMDILVSREDAPLGTGGALVLALASYPAELALVINGDSLTDAPVSSFLESHAQSGALASLLLVPVADAARYGLVETDDTGRVTGFVEKGRGGPGWISAGMYLLDAKSLAVLSAGTPASIECDVFPKLAAAGTLHAHKAPARFLDIGTPQSYSEAGRFLLENRHGRATVVLADCGGAALATRRDPKDPASLELRPGTAKALDRLHGLGAFVVWADDSPPDVAPAALEREHGRVIALLEAAGTSFDAVYRIDAGEADSGGPAPGILERRLIASGQFPAPLFVIGAQPRHLAPGLVGGGTPILLRREQKTPQALPEAFPASHVVSSLEEAARIIENVISAVAEAPWSQHDNL